MNRIDRTQTLAIILAVVIAAAFLVATDMMLTGEGIGWLIP